MRKSHKNYFLVNIMLTISVKIHHITRYVIFLIIFRFERFEVLAVFASTVLAQLGALFILKER